MTAAALHTRLDALEDAMGGTGRPVVITLQPDETEAQARDRAGAGAMAGRLIIFVERVTQPLPEP